MKAVLNHAAQEAFYDHGKAAEIAAVLSAEESDGWSYAAVKVSEKWSKVEIKDEDGQHVAYWSL